MKRTGHFIRLLALSHILLLCGTASFLQAQKQTVEPQSRFLTRVPFLQLTGGIIILRAQFDQFPDTLNFILDTGSSGISLDSSTAVNLGLQPVPTERTIRGIAGIRKVSFLYNRSLRLPGLQVDSLNFHINNYNILSSVYGEQIDGIIGYAILSRYILKLNYDSTYISFQTPGAIRYPRGGHLLKPAISQLVTQPVRVRDEKTVHFRFLFDIGAGLNMMFAREFVDDSNFISLKRKRFVKEVEGPGGAIDIQQTVIKEVKIGPYKFRSVPVFIFDDLHGITSYPYMGGLIGNDIMRRFNVVLNYPKGDIHITPNRNYNENFDYSYSGIELYLVDGKVIVGDVAKGSPAEAAGVKEGDEILAINKVFNQRLDQYKVALQQTKERIKLILQRNGELMEMEFQVKSIL